MALSFEFLKNCKPCELLRVKIEDAIKRAVLLLLPICRSCAVVRSIIDCLCVQCP
jgi:hypothetical protein